MRSFFKELRCLSDIRPYPPQTENLHHEIEMVVALGKGGAFNVIFD